MEDAPPITLLALNNELVIVTDDNKSATYKFKLKQDNGKGVIELVKEKALAGNRPSMTYRFLESGRLELVELVDGNQTSITRFQRLEAPESKNEKTAFALLEKAKQNPDYFQCFIARPIKSPNPDSHQIPGTEDYLELVGKPVINRNHVSSAKVFDDHQGQSSLGIELTPEGAMRMGQATRNNIGKPMALMIEGKMKLAPKINSVIHGSIALSGDFEKQELEKIGLVLSSRFKLSNGITLSKNAIRDKSLNKLKTLMLALYQYHSANQKFPVSKEKVKDAPVSWRVTILPLLGYDELYKQYALDEPWDSETNLKVLKQMPDVFRHPSSPLDSTETGYLGIAGDKAAFGIEKAKSVEDINDGTSNTAFLIESNSGIPWTKPEDFQLDSLKWKSQPQFDKAFSKLKFFDDEVICVGLGDASAMMLDQKKLQGINKISKNQPQWLNLFEIADGNVIEFEEFRFTQPSLVPSKAPTK